MRWFAQTLTTALSFADTFVGSPQIPLATAPLPQLATTFALIYGLPLFSYSHLASKIAENLNQFETNAFYHQTQLANASFTDINRPNVDTLYSEALVDLSSHNLNVTIPDVPANRFYVFPIYDVYGNNIVNIGTAGVSNTSGSYLVSYRPADPGYSSGGPGDPYTGYIYLPTPYGAIDLRIQVNGPNDVQEVNALQTQFILTPVRIPVRLAPRLTKYILFNGFSNDSTERLLQLTARFSLFNLPEVGSEIPKVTAILQQAGLSQGSYTTPSEVNLTLAKADAVAAVSSVAGGLASHYFLELQNDWSQLRAEYSGDFKEHYNVRAFVAAQGYLQLTAEQAIYPVYNVSNQLTSNISYTVTFNGKPPVNGFWSLTVYNETAYLIPNQWNIYSLGDRSAIRYPNCTLVYPGSDNDENSAMEFPNCSPPTGSDDNGDFTILLQTLDIPPPKRYHSNWIPTPSTNGSGIFNFNLRWYGPTDDLSNGNYEYPTVTPITPITAV